MAENDREETALSEMVMRYRMLQKETSDPIAARFLHDIVADLEVELDHQKSLTKEDQALRG